jgi:hypothetical protein
MPPSGQDLNHAGFATLIDALGVHNVLLASSRKVLTADDESLLDAFFGDVKRFIGRAAAAGAGLEAPPERQALQSQIDYWVGLLRRSGRPVATSTLAPFREPDLEGVACPYPGLRALRAGESPFGREALATELATKLQTSPMLAIVGASGTGKSSLVIAGVLPQLEERALRPSDGWTYLPRITPGAQALQTLGGLVGGHAAAFSKHPRALLTGLAASGAKRAVLVIDQFEELVTLEPDAAAREAFLANLVELVNAEGSPHRLIVTMRSEFAHVLERFPGFAQLFQTHAVHLYKMSPSELRAAIEGPARKVGLRFEEGLVDELIDQIAPDPSGLPLLQFTLRKLWEKKRRSRVTWESYRAVGGARQALAREAESLFDRLPANSKGIARDIFLALVVLDEKGEPLRKRVPLSVLQEIGSQEWVSHVIKEYCDAGLLLRVVGMRADEEYIELAHEALPRYWDRFSDWLKESRTYVEERQRFARQASEWELAGRLDEALVVYGHYLRTAADYKDLQPLEREFLDANRRAAERAAWKDRWRWIYGAVAVVLGLVLAVMWLFSAESPEERARALLDKAGLASDSKERLDLAIEAFETVISRPLPEVTGALYGAIKAHAQSRNPRAGEEQMWADPHAAPVRFGTKGETYVRYAGREILVPSGASFANVGVLSSTRIDKPRFAVLRYPDSFPRREPGSVQAASPPSAGETKPIVQVYEPNNGRLEAVGDVVRIDACENEPAFPRPMALKLSTDGAVLTYACASGNRVLVWPTTSDQETKARADAVRTALERPTGSDVFFERDGQRFVTVSTSGRLTVWRWSTEGSGDPVMEARYSSDFLAVYAPLDVTTRSDNQGFAVLDPLLVVTYFEVTQPRTGSQDSSWVAPLFRLSVNDPSRPPAIGLSFYDNKCLWVKRQGVPQTQGLPIFPMLEDYPVERILLRDLAVGERMGGPHDRHRNPCRPK